MNRRQFFKTLIGAAIAAKILPERTTAMSPAFGYPYGKYKTGLVGEVHDFTFRPTTYISDNSPEAIVADMYLKTTPQPDRIFIFEDNLQETLKDIFIKIAEENSRQLEQDILS